MAGHLIAHSLRGEGFDASEDGTGRGTPIVPVAFSCKDHGADAGSTAPTLRAMGHDGSHANAGGQVAVAFTASEQSNGFAWESDVYPTLQAHPQSETSNIQIGVRINHGVRRLTPVECERLQGMPDNHTRIPWRGKPAEQCPDGPRYRAIGNSWAVPVARWIGERIALCDEIVRAA